MYLEAGDSIVVNARFATQVATGVQRYAWEITKRLNSQLSLIQPARKMPALAGHLWEQTLLSRRVPRNSILWSPGGSGPLRIPNQVVTIHDIAQLEHPEWYDRRFAMWYAWLTPRLVKRVAHVLTVSQFSRARIIEYLGLNPEKISVIPLGVDDTFFVPPTTDTLTIRKKYGLPERFVLTVGSIAPRKNFHRILSAWRQVCTDYKDLSLVVVGHKGLRFSPEFKDVDVPASVIFTDYVPNSDLPLLYRAALVFLYPSLYEGFGLPVLEALAAGTPVITSEDSALSELANGIARKINPNDDKEIAAALREVIEDEGLQRDVEELGPAYARQFSWRETANRTYQTLLDVHRSLKETDAHESDSGQ